MSWANVAKNASTAANTGKTFKTGTGIVTTTGTAVAGTNTIFETELAVGDMIIIESQTRFVAVRTNDTTLTLDRALSSNVSNKTFQYKLKWSNQAKT